MARARDCRSSILGLVYIVAVSATVPACGGSPNSASESLVPPRRAMNEAGPTLPKGPTPEAGSSMDASSLDSGSPDPDAGLDAALDATSADAARDPAADAGPPPAYCATDPWMGLEACGWPGPANTGPDRTHCPGGKLVAMGSSTLPMPTLELSQAGAAINCAEVYGRLHVTAQDVTITNSIVHYDSGKLGEAANATAPIVVEDGASATIDHVEIDGMDGVHACVWDQGTSLAVGHVDCHGVNDGIFTWADTAYSPTSGDNFTVQDSYFHDFTTLTANGHEDGFQTEGSANGLIKHNTFQMTTEANSAVAIWNSLKSSADIAIEGNLMEGGGATVYATDYSPSETSPQGGFSLTSITITNNVFSNHVSPCVGQWFVWYARPAEPYGGGPTDGWHRTGNFILETGESVDDANPTINGQLCQ